MKHEYHIFHYDSDIKLKFGSDDDFLIFLNTQEERIQKARESFTRVQEFREKGFEYKPGMNEIDTVRFLKNIIGSYHMAQELFKEKRQEYLKNNPFQYDPGVHKIENIKRYKEHTGCDLGTAKNAIENLMHENLGSA